MGVTAHLLPCGNQGGFRFKEKWRRHADERRLPTHNQVRLQPFALAYNLGNFPRRLSRVGCSGRSSNGFGGRGYRKRRRDDGCEPRIRLSAPEGQGSLMETADDRRRQNVKWEMSVK